MIDDAADGMELRGGVIGIQLAQGVEYARCQRRERQVGSDDKLNAVGAFLGYGEVHARFAKTCI